MHSVFFCQVIYLNIELLPYEGLQRTANWRSPSRMFSHSEVPICQRLSEALGWKKNHHETKLQISPSKNKESNNKRNKMKTNRKNSQNLNRALWKQGSREHASNFNFGYIWHRVLKFQSSLVWTLLWGSRFGMFILLTFVWLFYFIFLCFKAERFCGV